MQQMPPNMAGFDVPASAQGPQTTADQMARDSGGYEAAGQEPASPEEQAAYDALVKAALRAVHSEGLSDQIAESILNSQAPADALGSAVGTLMGRVIDAAVKKGIPIVPEAVLPAATEVFENVVEIAEAVGVGAMADPKVLDRAYFIALDELRQRLVEIGVLTPEQAAAEMADLQALDQSGALKAPQNARGMA